jgi:O-antigen/teichoic acid export membrane protein
MTLVAPVAAAGTSTSASTRGGSRVFRESVALHASMYVFILFKLVAGFLVARFLGPAMYGVRTALGLAVDYEPYAHLGTYDSMLKEVPYHRARGDAATANAILSTVFTTNLVAATAVGVLLAVAGWVVSRSGAEPLYGFFLFFLAVYAVVNRVRMFYATYLVADKRAYLLSQIRMLFGFLNGALAVSLVIPFGLPGLFSGLLLSAIVTLAWTMYRVRWIPAFAFSGALLWRLIRAGAPIMLIGLLFVLFRSVDKVIILGMLPHELLGQFAVAAIASAVVFDSVGDLLRVMFFPRLMEQVGRDSGRAGVRTQLLQLTFVIGCLAPLLVGVLYLTVHLPIAHLAGEYLPAVEVARALAVGKYFFVLSLVPVLVGIAVDRQGAVLLLTAGAITLNVMINIGLIASGFGIGGVAIGTGVSFALYSAAILAFAVREVGGELSQAAKVFGGVLLPFAYAVALLLAIDLWQPIVDPGPVPDLGITVLKLGAFVALYAIVPFRLRRHPAFMRVWEHLPRLRRARADAAAQ